MFTAQPIFAHRNNADGTIDSIYRKCFKTIASSQSKAELEHAERKHQCDPRRLEYLESILNRVSKGGRSEGFGRLSGD